MKTKLTPEQAKIRELIEDLSPKLENSPTWYTEDVAEALEKAIDWAKIYTWNEFVKEFVQKT